MLTVTADNSCCHAEQPLFLHSVYEKVFNVLVPWDTTQSNGGDLGV